jgi:flotillin
MAEPLAKVDKITIVSTGNGTGGAGANKIVADVASMIAQAPALFETLSGMKMGDLFARIPAIREAAVQAKVARAEGEIPEGETRGGR